MSRTRSVALRRRATCGLLFLVWMLGARPAAAQATAPLQRGGDRTTVQECARCHDREYQRLRSGTHAQVLHAAALPGCETCHGPGAAHATARDNDPMRITMPARLPAEQQSALCATCHSDQIRLHGGDPKGFLVAGHSCTDCHSVHGRAAAPELPGVQFLRRSDAAAHAEPVGSRRCAECHPVRDELLAASHHASLSTAASTTGCEGCHGAGSLHAEGGAGRLVTRPDRAQDGIATCRSCHAAVDEREFHWVGRRKPYLSEDVTCTTCHVIHAPRAAATVHPDAAAPTNRACAACHAPAMATMPDSIHHPLGGLDTPLEQGCGTCHAGALAHANAGGVASLLVPWLADATRQAEVCLDCHGSERSLGHVRHGDHLRAGVRCTDCHGPLHEAHRGDVVASAERRCKDCHADVEAQFQLPNRHPVPEGRMRCTSCHDVHGGRRRAFDSGLTERVCVGCHANYRGPFVFAHQASRREGCVVCHTPHGSSNRRMLQQATTQQSCLQCHGDFPAFHDQTPGAVFTNCIRCHTEVHGSNHSRYLLR